MQESHILLTDSTHGEFKSTLIGAAHEFKAPYLYKRLFSQLEMGDKLDFIF